MSIPKNTLVMTCLLTTIGVIPFLKPQAAMACSCMRSTPAEQMERADVVFTGRVTNKTVMTDDRDKFGGNRSIHWTFAVEESHKGSASTEQVVVSASNGAACGINFQMGERYQVFANQYQNNLRASLCSGTQRITEEVTEEKQGQSQESISEPSPCAEGHSNPQ